tara:strand:- start:683 stop:1144 length:462 start_codon:yes stop_codon:yes gene_type:complete
MANKKVDLSADEIFEKCWKLYPRKKAKFVAQKAFKRNFKLILQFANEQGLTVEEVIRNGVKVILANLQDQDIIEAKRFIPHFSTWLNQRRWEDIDEIDLEDLEVVDGKVKQKLQWFESASGIEEKGKEYDLFLADFGNNFPQFKIAVMAKAEI